LFTKEYKLSAVTGSKFSAIFIVLRGLNKSKSQR
jgi:hypothetical protein